MERAQTTKITVHVPSDLLKRARRAARGGISEAVRKGLELLAAQEAYEGLRRWRGKYKFSIDLNELREDRELPGWLPTEVAKKRSGRR